MFTSNGLDTDLVLIKDFPGRAKGNYPDSYFHVALLLKSETRKYIFVDPVNAKISDPFDEGVDFEPDKSQQGKFVVQNKRREDLFYDYERISPQFSVSILYIEIARIMNNLNRTDKARAYCQKAVAAYPGNHLASMCVQAMTEK